MLSYLTRSFGFRQPLPALLVASFLGVRHVHFLLLVVVVVVMAVVHAVVVLVAVVVQVMQVLVHRRAAVHRRCPHRLLLRRLGCHRQLSSLRSRISSS